MPITFTFPRLDFYRCATCAMPGACKAARHCAHATQEYLDMAATVTASLWLKLLEHTDIECTLSPAEIRPLLVRYKWSDRALSQMAEAGFLRVRDGRYYVHGDCTSPTRITMMEYSQALAAREARIRKRNETKGQA